ncbi:hypothetical protein EBX31_00150, partial [bacterium]|nr:hypothetical protein [bacterium]
MTGIDTTAEKHKVSLFSDLLQFRFLTIFALLFYAVLGGNSAQKLLGQDEAWVEQSEILKRIEKGFSDPPSCKKMVDDG